MALPLGQMQVRRVPILFFQPSLLLVEAVVQRVGMLVRERLRVVLVEAAAAAEAGQHNQAQPATLHQQHPRKATLVEMVTPAVKDTARAAGEALQRLAGMGQRQMEETVVQERRLAFLGHLLLTRVAAAVE